MIIVAIVVTLAGIAWYALSPLFMNKHVNDALPIVEMSEQEETEVSPIAANREPSISAPITVIPTTAHPASGQVRIVQNGERAVIRYENYKTINGPDVRVYLADDLKATNFVDLGPIKGTEGNINYEVPAGVDVSKYRYVLTWCEDFAVLFNSADIASIR